MLTAKLAPGPPLAMCPPSPAPRRPSPHLRPGADGAGGELGGRGSRAGRARSGSPLPRGGGRVSGAGSAAQGGPGERRRGFGLLVGARLGAPSGDPGLEES